MGVITVSAGATDIGRIEPPAQPTFDHRFTFFSRKSQNAMAVTSFEVVVVAIQVELFGRPHAPR